MYHANFARLVTVTAVLFLFMANTAPVHAGEDERVAATVMELARAQWAAEIAGKPAADQYSATADDYTEFNPGFPTRIDGKAMAVSLAAADTSLTPLFSDMQNAKVQVYGNTAILTYNFAGVAKGKDGKVAPNIAKSTRVYVKMDGGWKLVHANFAPVVTP